jgi:hypothetical protein
MSRITTSLAFCNPFYYSYKTVSKDSRVSSGNFGGFVLAIGTGYSE